MCVVIHSTLPLLFPFLHCVCVCVISDISRQRLGLWWPRRLAHISHWLRTCTYRVKNVHYQPYRLGRLCCRPVDLPFEYLNTGKKSLCGGRRGRKTIFLSSAHTHESVCYSLHCSTTIVIFPFLFSGVDLILSLMILTQQCLII